MMLAGGTYEMFITGVFFVSYLLIVGIALMNLLMAIIVEGSMEQSRNDVEVAQQLKSEMMKKYLPKLYQVFMDLDEDGSGSLGLEEVQGAPESVKGELMKLVGQDDIEELFQVLDRDGGGELDIEEFFDGISQIVMGKVDMDQLRMMKFITQANQKQKEEFESMNQKIDFVNQKIDRLYSSFYGSSASGASARLPPPPDSYMDDRTMKGYVKKDEFA